MDRFEEQDNAECEPLPRRARRLAVLAVALSMAVGSGGVAVAAGETLQVQLTQVDGGRPFTADSTPGNDSSASNGIVRTNDTLIYQPEIRVEGGVATNTTFTMTLPRGVEMKALPAYCLTGSTVTPATLPAPVTDLVATSYLALPQQVLTCKVGTRSPGSNQSYPVPVAVRSEVPHGTQLGPVSAEVTTDAITNPVSTNTVSATVSAAPRFDLSKNAMATTPDTGYLWSSLQPCQTYGRTGQCYQYAIPAVVSVPAGGKGSTPLVGPISFTDDLTPASLYGTAVNDLAAYGAGLISCDVSRNYQTPASGIGNGQSATVAVRDSGSFDCKQAGPGTAATVTITGADTSAYTYPTQVPNPPGTTTPADRAYVISMTVYFEVPLAAVQQYGTPDTPGSPDRTLNLHNVYRDFTGQDMTGQTLIGDDPANNVRNHSARVASSGYWEKQFAGYPGDPSNTPAAQYMSGWALAEGPSGATTVRSGSGVLAPGQNVVSLLSLGQRSPAGMPAANYLVCDGWNKSTLALAATDAPAATFENGWNLQSLPSGGQPVWLSGYLSDNNWAKTAPADVLVQVQYAAPDGADLMSCDDPAVTWYDSPQAVPGNDPAKLADGLYTGVGRVRALVTLPAGQRNNVVQAGVSIGLRALPNPDGTILPNRASGKTFFADDATLSQAIADPTDEARAQYNEVTNTGWLGDRLKIANAIARLGKDVRQQDGSWGTGTPSYTVGDRVDYRLRPTLTSGVSSGIRVPVTVEDCLPADVTFASATPVPSLVRTTTPADAEINCDAGETFVRWELGDQAVNRTIDPITYTVTVRQTATPGTKTNTALVRASADPSVAAARTATAGINIDAPAGVRIDKTALTPLVEVNRAGETTRQPLLWSIGFVNVGTGNVTDLDIVDVLPENGSDGTDFDGNLAFVGARVTAGDSLTLLYTKSATVQLDPNDPTNSATGSTTWCSAVSGGSVVRGAGTTSDCPASAGEVTGLRILRPGAFPAGEQLAVEVQLDPTANTAGDVYVNSTMGRSATLTFPVGPVSAPERVVAGSIGDRVWLDRNGNGVQDAGEPGLPGRKVTLTGTDTDGNAVTATTTTDDDGHYSFPGLAAGDYVVDFDRTGLASVGELSPTGAGDAGTDSDPDPATGTATVTLATGQNLVTVDAGVRPTGTIGDRVWLDADRNGLQDAGEDGLAGVQVRVRGTDLSGSDIDVQVTTDANGRWTVDGLYPGEYRITVTPPSGYTPSPVQEGSDPAVDSNGTSFTVRFTGPADLTLDTGLSVVTPTTSPTTPTPTVTTSPTPTNPTPTTAPPTTPAPRATVPTVRPTVPSVRASTTPTAGSSTLPRTGATVLPLLVVGGGLVLLGAALLRRRRR